MLFLTLPLTNMSGTTYPTRYNIDVLGACVDSWSAPQTRRSPVLTRRVPVLTLPVNGACWRRR